MRYRWVILALVVVAWAAVGAVVQGLPSIGPQLRDHYSLGLAQTGLLLAAAPAGMAVAIVAWGMLADRIGERRVLAIGMAGAGSALVAAALAGGFVAPLLALVVVGLFGASANGASARAIMSWFARDERGLAMGIRQAALPIGSAAAAVGLPLLAAFAGPRAALLGLAATMLAAGLAGAIWLRDAPKPDAPAVAERGHSPLTDRRVLRVTGASALLAGPQFAFVAFLVLYLHDARGLSAADAAVGLIALQLTGAATRIALGRVSDVRGERVRLLGGIAVLQAVTLPVAAFVAAGVPGPGALVALAPVAVLAVSWNGLANTVAAEAAPPGRSGTTVAFQNTAVVLVNAVMPPAFGALVSITSWEMGFALLAAPPMAAALLLRPLAPPRAAPALERHTVASAAQEARP